MTTATWNGTKLAETDEPIVIEGNYYFPPAAVNKDYLQSSDYHTDCFWKGKASYYNVKVGDEANENAAFYYPEPMEGSIPKVGHDFTNYVSFWHGVEVE